MNILLVILSFLFSCNNDPTPSPELKKSMERGAEVYEGFCMSCHLSEGQGEPNAFPPLADSDYLMNKREESIRAVKYGLSGEITVNGITYNSAMASFGLSDDEVADVMNYILNSWGNEDGDMVTASEVSKIQQ